MKNLNHLLLLFLLFLSTNLKAQNNALNFDGANDFVQLNSSFDNGNAFDGDFTIEFWIKTQSVDRIVMSKWNESTDGTFKIEITSEGKIAFTSHNPTDGIQRMESDEVIDDDEWHHVAISKSISSSFISMFINAEEQSSFIFLQNELTNTPHPLYLGKEESNILTPFEGTIDELRIWGESRGCPNIFSNMLNQQIEFPFNTNLLVQHSFNQGTAAGDNTLPPINNLIDNSGNGNNGTLFNFALNGSASNWIAATNGVNDSGFTNDQEINVRQNTGRTIRNGDITPSFEDDTDFGLVYGNGDEERYYVIENLGDNPLNLSNFPPVSSSNTDFTIDYFSTPPSSIPACGGVDFIVRFNTNSTGIQESTIIIVNDDPDEPNYTFTVRATAAAQITLTGNSQTIGNGSFPNANSNNGTDFGSVDKCQTVTKTYTIENTGGEVLEIYGDIQVSGNSAFKVINQPAASVATGNSTTFEIEYSPTKDQFQEATVYIRSNANPFIFYIVGEGNSATYPEYEWEEVGEEGFSDENTAFHSLKIANGGTPYIAFQEGANQITRVMRFDGSSWQNVGTMPTTVSTAYQSLVIDNENNLYVAYQNGASSNQTVVLKYDGTNWATLGNNISGNNNSYQNLALDKAGNLYIAFRNETGKAKVMTFNTSTNTWENIGTDPDGFSEGDVSDVDIIISEDNYILVVFKDEADSDPNNQGAEIMFFENNEWTDFEDLAGVTASLRPTNQKIALDIYGTPYVALQDGSDSDRGRVYTFDNGWGQFLSAISNGSSAIGNIITGIDASVYICFQDQNDNNKPTVKKSGEGWGNIGDIEGIIENINLTLDKNGILYVAFSDSEDNGKTTVRKFIPNDAEPEISIQGNYQNIVSGSTTPIISNDTDFGIVNVNVSKTVTYTIHNTGDLGLNIYSIEVSNNNQGDFFIGSFSNFVDEGDSITFDVVYFSQFPTTSTATITINSSDCDEGAYSFDVKAIADVLAPVFELYENTALISNNNPGNSTFGNVFRCGAGITKTFRIKNDGNIDLEISSFSQNGSTDFTVVGLSSPSPIIIPAQQSRNFTVTFTPSSTTTQTKSITINNTDLNANPYTFYVTGTGQNDTEAPVLIPLQNVIRNMDSLNCFYTNLATNRTQFIIGTAIDDCSVIYSYALSGATTGTFPSLTGIQFNKGVTTINWNATDVSNNASASSQFTVTVVDNRNPIIQAPDDIFRETDLYSCSADSTNLNLGTPIVSDNCLFRVFNDAPAELPIGETVVIWTAIDSAGNTATAEQIVSITDPLFVTPSDSLILVDIYNQTGGQNWTRSWNLATPVSTWNGININCGAIASINLSNNNLTGVLPRSVLNLAQINEPNFSLQIGGNRLGFESAEDFVGQISNFSYAPQAKLYAPFGQIISQGDGITFSSTTEGDFNSYQWYKNQNRINNATSPTLTITNTQIADAGIYVCEVKNSRATQLTLERHPIALTVEGFLNPTDSIALVRIYQETGGNTTWNTRWDLTKRVATWEGITLSGDKLIELDLSSFGLTGTLPEVFDAELFSELRYLSFFDNELEGAIPATIGTIITLTYLDLDKNNFEGAVPASFGNLANLQAFWLSRNNLTSLPDEIGNLISLQNLYLNDNKFSSLPETIGNLSELLVLNVSDNDLTRLPNSITNLRRLIQFYANRNFIITLPIGMENLTSLVIFEINTNNLTSLNTALLQLTNLRELRVGENKLEFDDLLPFVNRNFGVFDYAPQAPINDEVDILAAINSSVTFTITTQGNGNSYQWLRGGNPVSTLQTFTINRVRSRDAGLYIALITNPNLPDLTLQRRSILLNIECQASLNFEINQPQQTTFCEGQPFGLKLSINDEFIATSQIRWRKDGIIIAFANQNNYTVTEAGIYTAEVVTVNGCTALSNQIQITIVPQVEVTISLATEGILESNITSQEPVTYQWLKDGNPIESGFESTYTPTQTGEYSLSILTESGCSSVSETIIFTADDVTGIEEPKELRNLALFPNPNNGSFFIDFGAITPNGEPTFILIDAIGRKINIQTERISSIRYKAKTINVAGGIYYIQIQTQDGIAFRKFVIEE